MLGGFAATAQTPWDSLDHGELRETVAEESARRFDGFSVGSNDLTQRVLGITREIAERELILSV